ncbi:glycosyltransferase family 32 [Paramyrothecium foliicola]|nr:glycosyltransferase family 32 [Paramyrothecium foliicola]
MTVAQMSKHGRLQAVQDKFLQFLAWRGLRIIIITGCVLLGLSTLWLYQDVALARLTPDVPLTTVSQESRMQIKPFRSAVHHIPPKIWHIMLAKQAETSHYHIDPKALEDAPTWLALNPDYQFTLVGSKGADEFLHRHYAERPEVINAFNDMVNTGMKSDLLRYLLLSVEGGVYSDTDTIARRAIDEWVPKHLRKKVRMVVGIEWDRQDAGPVDTIPYFVQFCQWTIAAAPGHPVFDKMIDRVLLGLDALTKKHNKPVNKIQPEYFDVLNTTGPPAWTSVVFQQLQEYDPSLKDTEDLSRMKEPRLIGDILVLAIDGFGMGQRHSGSTHDGSIPDQALISHRFRGSWKEKEQS